jgi:hypothetical protein
LLALGAGCAAREAENPRTLLGEDYRHNGVNGDGTAADPPGAADQEPQPGRAAERNPNALATRAECAAAADHLVTLGVDLAIREEADPDTRQRLIADRQAALQSEPARRHREEWTRECLDHGTVVREARCIARIRAEADIDRCVGGP